MKIIRQIGIIFAICWFSEVIESILPFSFPASVTGMILLFICLAAGILKIEHVQEKAGFLLENMAFFFIPAGVGILEHYESVKGVILPLLAVCVITTVLTFAAASLTVRATVAVQKRIASGKDAQQTGEETE